MVGKVSVRFNCKHLICKCLVVKYKMWKSPYYNFIVKDSNSKTRQITIKVTDSAIYVKPNISNAQRKVFDKLAELIPKNAVILDFGAGNLRITNYLLDKQYIVYPVEFDELQKRTTKIKKLYTNARQHYKKCKTLTFPEDILDKKIKVDLVIAVNVHNVMPVIAERFLSLIYARTKLKDDGYFLYFGQHDEPNAMQNYHNNVIGDGCYNNENKRYQTFYHNFNINELDSMFLTTGFKFNRKYSVGSTVHARLYKKSQNM